MLQLQQLTLYQPSSRELDQSQSWNWKDSERLTLTDPSDKNGTTKETKEKDLKKKEKLPRKTTDLLKYLNVLPNHYFFL